MFEQETSGILVRVQPNFLADESDPDEHRFVWSYAIEIVNLSHETVQLISRYWRITDAKGATQEVRGAGVIGQQPVIEPGQSYRYSSAAPLAEPYGLMMGAYQMVRTDSGEPFEIAVPAFTLDSPYARTLAN